MGFIGRFELKVPDVLQILSLTKKTGRLRLSRLGNTGEILFNGGKIIYAASDSHHTTLGNILMHQQHISERALMAALELQHLSTDNKRLGAILIEKGLITPHVLHQAIRSQIEQVITEFLSWEEGFFRFDMMDVADDDGINVDATEFLARKGISLESLLLEGARRLDEESRATEEASLPEAPPPALPQDLTDDGRHTEAPPVVAVAQAAPAPPPETAAVENMNEPRDPMRLAWLIPETTPDALILDDVSVDHAGNRQDAERIATTPPPPPYDVPQDKPDDVRLDHRAEAPTPAELAPEPPVMESPTPRTPLAPSADAIGAGPPSPRTQREPAAPEISLPNIADEIALSAPISPWVLIMNFAPEVVSRGVFLSVRNDGFTAFDHFGLADGIDLEDDRLGPIKIPLKEPSVFGVIANRRATYRGKIGGGKWTDYFLDRLGGHRPVEALVIPIIVVGRVVALFYGDNAGTGKPIGDVERLEALIRQAFSTLESSLLARQSQAKSRR